MKVRSQDKILKALMDGKTITFQEYSMADCPGHFMYWAEGGPAQATSLYKIKEDKLEEFVAWMAERRIKG